MYMFFFHLFFIYSIFTALVETYVSHMEHINLAKLHKRTINYMLEKKFFALGKD